MGSKSPTSTTTTSQPAAAVLAQYGNVTNLANQVAQTPYQPYGGELVAPLTGEQNKAIGQINQDAGIAAPYMNQGLAQAQLGAQAINSSAGVAQPDLNIAQNQASLGVQNINNATGVAQPYINEAQNYAQQGAQSISPTQFSGDALQQYMSPYQSDVIKATEAQIGNQNQQQQQQIIGNSISSGAFGGDRTGVAQAALAGQQDIANNSTLASLNNQNYSQALGEFNTQQQVQLAAAQNNASRQGQAAFTLGQLGQEAQGTALAGANAQLQSAQTYGQLGQLNQNIALTGANAQLQSGAALGQLGQAAQGTALSGASAQLQAGGLQQGTQQAQDTAAYQQSLNKNAYPFQTASWLANISEGIGTNSGGTTTGTQTPPSMIPGVVGAGLSAASLFLSDERAKEDIVPVGKTFDHQTIYKFKYKGHPETHIGLIAQDVEKKHPEAVGTLQGGLKGVDYDEATRRSERPKRFADGGLASAGYDPSMGMGDSPYGGSRSYAPSIRPLSMGHSIPNAMPIQDQSKTGWNDPSLQKGMQTFSGSPSGQTLGSNIKNWFSPPTQDQQIASGFYSSGGHVHRRGYEDGGSAAPEGGGSAVPAVPVSDGGGSGVSIGISGDAAGGLPASTGLPSPSPSIGGGGTSMVDKSGDLVSPVTSALTPLPILPRIESRGGRISYNNGGSVRRRGYESGGDTGGGSGGSDSGATGGGSMGGGAGASDQGLGSAAGTMGGNVGNTLGAIATGLGNAASSMFGATPAQAATAGNQWGSIPIMAGDAPTGLVGPAFSPTASEEKMGWAAGASMPERGFANQTPIGPPQSFVPGGTDYNPLTPGSGYSAPSVTGPLSSLPSLPRIAAKGGRIGYDNGGSVLRRGYDDGGLVGARDIMYDPNAIGADSSFAPPPAPIGDDPEVGLDGKPIGAPIISPRRAAAAPEASPSIPPPSDTDVVRLRKEEAGLSAARSNAGSYRGVSPVVDGTGTPTAFVPNNQINDASGNPISGRPITAPPAIKQAFLGQESGNQSGVGTSVDGAQGPGQIEPRTFAQFARPGERIDNPADNRAVSGRILDSYYTAYNGDPARMAVAYFSGPGNVAPPGSPTPWIRDTHDGNGKYVSSYVSDMSNRIGGVSQAANNNGAATPTGLSYPVMPRVVGHTPSGVAILDATVPVDSSAASQSPAEEKNFLGLPKMSDQMRMALLSAGLGMMSSTSPYAAVGIGQGAQQGVNTYMKAQQLANETMTAQSESANRQSEIGTRNIGALNDAARVKAMMETSRQVGGVLAGQNPATPNSASALSAPPPPVPASTTPPPPVPALPAPPPGARGPAVVAPNAPVGPQGPGVAEATGAPSTPAAAPPSNVPPLPTDPVKIPAAVAKQQADLGQQRVALARSSDPLFLSAQGDRLQEASNIYASQSWVSPAYAKLAEQYQTAALAAYARAQSIVEHKQGIYQNGQIGNLPGAVQADVEKVTAEEAARGQQSSKYKLAGEGLSPEAAGNPDVYARQSGEIAATKKTMEGQAANQVAAQGEMTKQEPALVDQYSTRQAAREGLNELVHLNETYETGGLSAAAAEADSLVKGMKSKFGIDLTKFVPKNWDATNYQEFLKNSYANIFKQIKDIGGRPLVTEITGLGKASAGPEMQPDANAQILSQGLGQLDYLDKQYDEYFKWRNSPNGKMLTVPGKQQFVSQFNQNNPIDSFVANERKDIAPKGGQIPPDAQKVDGQAYSTTEGKQYWNASTGTFGAPVPPRNSITPATSGGKPVPGYFKKYLGGNDSNPASWKIYKKNPDGTMVEYHPPQKAAP